MSGIQINSLEGIGDLRPGDDLAAVILKAMADNAIVSTAGDVLVVAQKAVSKAENRFIDLDSVTPSPRARALAEEVRKDPQLVELVLSESTAVVRASPGVLIVRHRSGHVMANAGIDASNLMPGSSAREVLLLPVDADASAAALRAVLMETTGVELGIVISDSFGRPWRIGVTNVAIGAAGIPALLDKRQQQDRYGRVLEVTQVAVGDLLASAAGLAMGEGDEGRPVIHVRGLPRDYSGSAGHNNPAASLIRPLEEDLFR